MLNSVQIMGRLTADPELKLTSNNTAVCRFTIASDRGYKDQSGNKLTDFIDCVAWRNSAEFVCKYLKKGRLVVVEGNLETRTFEDPETKKRRKAVDLKVNAVHFADSKKEDGAEQGQTDNIPDGFAEVSDDVPLPF